MQFPASSDTSSPWYEAFAEQAQAAVGGTVRALVEPGAEAAVRPEPGEADGSAEALFDCYNA